MFIQEKMYGNFAFFSVPGKKARLVPDPSSGRML
jgi:hypothetical protein